VKIDLDDIRHKITPR